MTPFDSALRDVISEFSRRAQRWALVGGLAVSARAEPRFTRDIDVAIAVDDDAAAEELVRGLLDSGYALGSTIEHEETGRLATVRLLHSHRQVEARILVDLMFASSGLEPEIVAAAEQLETLPGVQTPVAQTGHLIALKVLARDDATRPQDIADLRALVAVAQAGDIELARKGCALITERGYNRDRDLNAAIDEILQS